jgi:hypothetical protein
VPVSLPVGEQFKSHSIGALRAGYSFSYSNTDHYYIGENRDAPTERNVAPATLGIENAFELEYDMPRGLTFAAEVPFVHTEQSREGGGASGNMMVRGLGDIRLLARYWIVDNPVGLRWYASLGLRAPTGKSDGKFLAKNGAWITRDLAAQAGTGNFAGIAEIGGNTHYRRIGVALDARYIFTPAATTVNNFRHELTGTGPVKNSDSDAGTARISLSTPLSGGGSLSQVAAFVTGDAAWVPYDDLFGKTEGFRRAGPILLAGPGMSWSPNGAWTLSAGTPITLYRNVQRNGGNVQAWTLQVAVSYDIRPGRGE